MKTMTQKFVGTTCFTVTSLVLAMGAATATAQSTESAAQALGQRVELPAANATQATQAQLGRAQAKFDHAMNIANQFKAQAAAEGVSGDDWRFEMVGNMMKGAEADFAAVALAPSFSDAVGNAVVIGRATPSASATAISAAGASAKNLGDATDDLVYVPIVPCRILDTRPTFIPASTPKTYFFYAAASNPGHGSCSVTSQIPGSYLAAAFAANVTVDETGLTGFAAGAYLQIYPQAGSTTTSFMNFAPNQIIANAGVISVNQANSEFTVNTSASANVIIDTYGAFITPQATALDCVNTAYGTTVNFTTAARDNNAAAPACAAGYTRVSTFPNAGGDYNNLALIVINDGNAFWHYYGAGTATGYVAAKCCRVPGR